MSSVTLVARLMVIANQPPIMEDPSGAIGHRIIALETKRSWAGQEAPHLTDKLMAELPGILRWSMEGWRRLHDRGHFKQPSASQHIVEQYRCQPSFDVSNNMYSVQRATSTPAISGFGDGPVRVVIECGGRR
jgi:putative DNA primase/helicase